MHAELEQRLGFCGNLPTLPAVALKVIELANNPEVHLNDVARVIAMDPALVTKLFRAANSPLYGLRRKPANLRQALSVLGLQGTLALALGFSLMASSRGLRGLPLDLDQFWRRSLLAATASRALGERLKLKNLEELFLAGLLH
ncbi:MAG TPA: GGDEF domain-containing protein, partial [Candidatus Competibacteraceae bacterium]|nr:GGDEF domain-containing protein [Candidatus Competibacteraceae bacterium]